MTHGSAERESKTLRNVALTGCVGCLGLVVIVAIGISLLFFWSKSTIGTPAMDFIDAIDAGNYEQAYALTEGHWRGGRPFEEFERAYAALHDDLGPRQSIRSVGFNFEGRVTHPSEGRATYAAQYEDGSVLIEVSLEHGEDAWHVTDARYRRRLSRPMAACPHCGSAVEPSARFCAQCGEKLDEVRDEAPDEAPEEAS